MCSLWVGGAERGEEWRCDDASGIDSDRGFACIDWHRREENGNADSGRYMARQAGRQAGRGGGYGPGCVCMCVCACVCLCERGAQTAGFARAGCM